MYLTILACIAFSFMTVGIIYGVYMMIRDDRREEKKKKTEK